MSLNFRSSKVAGFQVASPKVSNSKVLGLALLSSLALTLTACGGSSSSSGDSTSKNYNSKNGKHTTNDTTSSTKKPPKKTTNPTMTQAEKDCAGLSKEAMLDAINKVRSQSRTCGTKNYPATNKLQWNSKLEQSAIDFATDMAKNNYFGLNHLDKNRRSYKERILATGYGEGMKGTPATGENIAAGQRNLEDAISSWLASPSHCENIMNAKAKDFAMACGYNENSTYQAYWVQHFGATK